MKIDDHSYAILYWASGGNKELARKLIHDAVQEGDTFIFFAPPGSKPTIRIGDEDAEVSKALRFRSN